MKISQLLSNPLIKFIGVAAIIYFGLFANKKSPDSLGNRLSSENIKKNFSEAEEKAKFIATNVKIAQNIEAERKAKLQKVGTENSQIKSNQDSISCGDIAETSYTIYDKNDKKIQFVAKEKFNVGAKKDPLIEKNVVGMKQSETKIIEVSKLSSDDQKLSDLLKSNKSDLKIQITVLNIEKNSVKNLSCN
jgi:hypothetical protein